MQFDFWKSHFETFIEMQRKLFYCQLSNVSKLENILKVYEEFIMYFKIRMGTDNIYAKNVNFFDFFNPYKVLIKRGLTK